MLLSLDTPNKLAVDDLLDRHKALVTPLQFAESSGEAASISGDLESSIEELASTAREMMELFQRRRAMLASIVGSATTSSKENLPPPLVALEAYRAELAEEQQVRIDGQLAEAREESEATLLEVEQQAQAALAEAKREAAKTMSRIEVEQTAAEAKRAEELRKVAAAEAQLAADREKLEREFKMDLPKIKHYLQAFLTPDNHHPLKGVTTEKVPYPYSHLESEGALNETEKGLERFGHIASREAGKRPRGPIADMYNIRIEHLSESQREAIVVAQQLLRTYGLLMVEKKMLLP